MSSDFDGLLAGRFQIFVCLFIPVTHQIVWLMNKNLSQLSLKSFLLPPVHVKSAALQYLAATFLLKEDESMFMLLKELHAFSKHHFILMLLKVFFRNVRL
jgi:hypothetical protein